MTDDTEQELTSKRSSTDRSVIWYLNFGGN